MQTGKLLRTGANLILGLLLIVSCEKQNPLTPPASTDPTNPKTTNLFPPPPLPFPPPIIRIWLTAPNPPLPPGGPLGGWKGRFSMASFTITGKGYLVAGGILDAANHQSTSSDMLCFDTATHAWSQKASFPGYARTDMASFVANNQGYVCTGMGPNFSTPTTENWRYDPIQNYWTRKTSFPGIARSFAVGAGLNGKGYVGTGAPSYGVADGGLSDWWQYDPVADHWTQKRDLPGSMGRWGAASFANDQPGGKAYVTTGLQSIYGSGLGLGNGYAYDPASDTWSAMPVLNLPDTVPGRSYAVGLSTPEGGIVGTGYNGWNYNDFWMFSFATNSWSKLASIPGQRFMAQGFTIGPYIYVGGGVYGLGSNPPAPVNDFYSLYYW